MDGVVVSFVVVDHWMVPVVKSEIQRVEKKMIQPPGVRSVGGGPWAANVDIPRRGSRGVASVNLDEQGITRHDKVSALE